MTELRSRHPGWTIAAIASLGAGAIHAGAIGLHSDHPQLARIFVVMCLLQMGWGLLALLRSSTWLLPLGIAFNAYAVGGWVVTRLYGIEWIDGLEVRENPQVADTLCAALGATAAMTALAVLLLGRNVEFRPLNGQRLAFPAAAVAAVTLVAMWNGAGHVHSETAHGSGDAHGHSDSTATGDHGHSADDAHGSVLVTDETGAVVWPRPYDPAVGIDIGGVPGVSSEQETRARQLIEATQRELPRWSDYDDAVAGGWVSIGDERTGFEHLINRALIVDDKFLDPTAPESLVYQVRGVEKTLVSAMFMANLGVDIDDPTLTDYAGPLMQWHKHDNLCFRRDASGRGVVAGVLDAAGNCPEGSVLAGVGLPMVHVWIAPHPCGPFAALEGEGAGTAAVSDEFRVDMCQEHHEEMTASGSNAAASTAEVLSTRDDGSARLDLSGMPGVSDDERRRAEELVYVTRTVLPKFASTADAEAAGFTTIGDGLTGYEHYINWTYINDAHELDPDHPESLVYQVDPVTREKKLVSAMFMLGDEYTLDTVPNVGGPLTQWHIHNNLCFNRDPMKYGSTRVVGVTSEDGPCSFGIRLNPNPMIHVWIVPHQCGPFAALEGVGAGQVRTGEERLCDTAHAGH